MADAPLRRRPSPPASRPAAQASIATCEQCDSAFDLHGLHEQTALCDGCFQQYLDDLEVPFLEQYARFGAKAHRTVAESLFRGLVTADPDDRKKRRHGDRILVGKVNVDDHPDLAARYGIRGIPALVFFKDGQRVHQLIGVQPKEAIARDIEQYL